MLPRGLCSPGRGPDCEGSDGRQAVCVAGRLLARGRLKLLTQGRPFARCLSLRHGGREQVRAAQRVGLFSGSPAKTDLDLVGPSLLLSKAGSSHSANESVCFARAAAARLPDCVSAWSGARAAQPRRGGDQRHGACSGRADLPQHLRGGRRPSVRPLATRWPDPCLR
jgi:hypothetical protein